MSDKIITPVLEYCASCVAWHDRRYTVSICKEDSKHLFGLKKKHNYQIKIYFSKPKKKAYKFKIDNDGLCLFHKGEDFYLRYETEEWFFGRLPAKNLKKMWVRVKKVKRK